MAGNGLDKVTSQRMGGSPSRKKAGKDISLESYLRNSLEDLDASSRLQRGAGHVPQYDADFDDEPGDQSGDTWAQSFQPALNKERRPKTLLGSVLPYLAVAIICGATSGGALLYFMLRYSAPPAEVESTAPAEPETSYGEALSRSASGYGVNPPPAPSSPPGAEGDVSADAPRQAFTGGTSAKAQAAAAPEAARPTGLNPATGANVSQTDSGSRIAAAAPAAEAPPAVAAVPALPEPAGANQGSTANSDIAQAAVQHPKLPADQEDKMLKRGSTLLSQNDIAGARLVFHYLASHGSAKGAFALAESYDPKKLAGRHIAGITPDANQARTWYARAAEMGSKEAAAVLRKAAP